MGLIGSVVDAVLIYFSVVVLLTVPLVDSQCALPLGIHPKMLVRLKRFFEATYGDYMFEENTPFFVGIVWMEIFFLWPLSLANVFGILTKKSWVGTTLLMAGVATGTAMAAIFGELLGAGRASEKLVQVFVPFVAFSVLATLRGLVPRGGASAGASSAQKKRD